MGSPADNQLPDESREILGPVRKRMLENLKDLRNLEVATVLEAEIVARLLNGRRTSGELAEEIFGVNRDAESFHSYYMRVCRALHSLERRGYVGTKLFGRDRPYKLTQHCLGRLARLGSEEPPRLIPPHDAAVYASTIIISSVAILARTGFLDLTRQGFMIMFTVGILLSGISITRFIEMIRKVL